VFFFNTPPVYEAPGRGKVTLANLQKDKNFLLHKHKKKKTAYEVESSHAILTAVLK